MSFSESKKESFGLDNPAFVADENSSAIDLSPGSPQKPKRTYEPGEERRMLINIATISFAFTLLFTAFQSMNTLMNSFYPEGLGNDTNAVLYGSLVVSCMFLPTFLIRKFTVKWTLVFSIFGYSTYMAAQFVPEYYTMIPAAVVVGFCAAPLWSAKCTYLTHLGHEYAGVISDRAEVVIVKFFGYFFLAFQSSQIWGNLISSFVLSGGDIEGEKDISMCGPNFCPEDATNGSIREVTETERYTLDSIYLGCSLGAAAIVAIFVDPLIRYGELERDGASSKLTGVALFTATMKQMLNPQQLLIIPITIWSGMEQGFFNADFTQAYISCGWDIGKIGFVVICYGVCDALASISFGVVVRHFGRIPVFIFGALINISVIVSFFLWKPDPDEKIIFFVLAGLWGVGDAIWQTQINALYGVLFSHNEEPAFSNYRLWESLGFIIAFVSGGRLCIRVKLWMLIGVISTGMTGFMTMEILERRKARNTHNIN